MGNDMSGVYKSLMVRIVWKHWRICECTGLNWDTWKHGISPKGMSVRQSKNHYYEMPYIRQAYMNPTGLQQKPKREYVKIESRERGKVLSIPIQGYKLTKNNKQLNQCWKVVFELMMFSVMENGGMDTSRYTNSFLHITLHWMLGKPKRGTYMKV